MAEKPQKILRLILGDQLNINHSWFDKKDAHITYVMMEIRSETDYVTHHIQKVLAIFAAMRAFATELKNQGHNVIYLPLNDKDNLYEFSKNCQRLIEDHQFTQFEYQLPDEYRLDQHLKTFSKNLSIPVDVVDSEHFYCSRSEFQAFFADKKTFLMETFYRHMRKKHHVLIDENDQPLHGKWNFDAENGNKLPKKHQVLPPLVFNNDVSAIATEVQNAEVKTMGTVDAANLIWPITRAQSLELLDHFVKNCLPLFGTYQDAMAQDEWSIYHSRLSFSMNTKLLSPKEVVDKSVEAYFANPDDIAYHQLEGFVRQIIGWREYMRGIYWAEMPDYAKLNYFGNTRNLPQWYWTGETKMNCLSTAIKQSLQYAYAHHIQRLMITGNFALLAGIHPDEVDAWYLGIYIDAFEWVEMPNTRGMSQYADGGIVGSKPYVSSASYIHKMSNYCENCYYDKSKKTGDKACPFNSLYWNFYDQNEKLLSNNPRVGMMINLWHKMDADAKAALLEQAHQYLEGIEEL